MLFSNYTFFLCLFFSTSYIGAMKFQKIAPFEKHFKESYPDHLSPIYLVVCPKEGERKKILASLASFLERDSDFKRCPTIKDTVQHLMSGSLFSGKMGALFDGVEQLLKGEVEPLIQYSKKPNPSSYLILGAASSKNVADLYKAGKKEMVVLDLSSEKPWEEKQRLQAWVVQFVHSRKKKITPDAVEALFEQLPPDRLLLQQEVEKLLTYMGDRQEATRKDVATICSTGLEEKPFQVAQTIAFGKLEGVPQFDDVSTLLPLVASLRNQLEMGLKMCALLKKEASHQDIEAAFPRLWPKALNQALEGAKRKGAPFYKGALQDLFELELGLKSNAARPAALFTRFLATRDCHLSSL